MILVQTFSQLEEAVREKVQKMLAVGGLAADIKKSFVDSSDFNSGELVHKALQELISVYDVADFQKQGCNKGVLLSRKMMTSYRGEDFGGLGQS